MSSSKLKRKIGSFGSAANNKYIIKEADFNIFLLACILKKAGGAIRQFRQAAPKVSKAEKFLRNDDDIVALQGNVWSLSILDGDDIHRDFNFWAVGSRP